MCPQRSGQFGQRGELEQAAGTDGVINEDETPRSPADQRGAKAGLLSRVDVVVEPVTHIKQRTGGAPRLLEEAGEELR